jgi:hypothetical protein
MPSRHSRYQMREAREIEARLAYLVVAAQRVGRFDRRNLAIGVLLSAAGGCAGLAGSSGGVLANGLRLSVHVPVRRGELINAMPTNPAVDLDRIESEVATDVVVGDQMVSCCCFENVGVYVEKFTCRGQVYEEDQASEIVPSSHPRPVVDPPEL